ncbi:two-component sensor histidine kinase [Actinorhabdospora filicis]|uniref:Sensor histidine kinase MtrB n=1 Tax=Actinorhabdospora filicis TaxID=1785913 RepID=A0A9W6W926_9ACTN|nr:MtrAB system histidine kinase MtrB [Actinorhabdospora filicis]GLZ76250.1 two-component sensor histidine kinase [Actinorhabdospora filicis]
MPLAFTPPWRRPKVKALLRRAYRLVVRLARPVLRTWRGSLQFRVVAITMVASTVLVGAFGILVASSINDELLEQKYDATQSAMEQGRNDAVTGLRGLTGPTDYDFGPTATKLVKDLVAKGGGGDLKVMLLPLPATQERLRKQSPQRATDGYGYPVAPVDTLVPEDLRERVAAGGDGRKITLLSFDEKAPESYVVLGAPVTVGQDTANPSFGLYYFFPLDGEQAVSGIVGSALLVAGLALVLLLAALAWLVTRMVVTPVRAAARTAQRLSAGLLHERMTVRGADDLARLAGSFNLMAENLQQQIVRLEEMSRLQRRFTSDVSHELRTPLTTVRMAADLLHSSREDFPPAAARSAELLQDELNRFEDLLGELLEISRFDAGFAQLDAEAVDLNPIVRSVAASFDSLAERCGVEMRLTIPDSPTIAEVDPRRVQRVLRNLIGNAVEHAECLPVDIELAASHSAVAVSVRDRGVGLKPGEEKLVFNRFWRADPSRARQTGGTGLGLSISIEDAKLHGGWLEAAGEPGRGSVFRLTLPMRAGDRLLSSPLPLTLPGDPAETATETTAESPSEISDAGGVPSGQT